MLEWQFFEVFAWEGKGGSEVENMLDYKSKGLRLTLPILLSFG